eukprot:TRINITY_DN5127_c0_g1_i4.p3 TRINITY_DN5127_c0_g1~~TRINITY_DN5127_c0_g1_i4.p3  ORF type:complete len:106 (-),score=12.39 TRINITY_DN5127_c0_g1_i4:101-379(-)
MYGGTVQRQEHVTNCRQTAAQAVNAIMAPKQTDEYNYLPFFYSRVFDYRGSSLAKAKGMLHILGIMKMDLLVPIGQKTTKQLAYLWKELTIK